MPISMKGFYSRGRLLFPKITTSLIRGLRGPRSHYYSRTYYPIKNYRGLSPIYRGKQWAYVHFIRGAANHPVIYLRPTFGLQEFSHRHIICNNTTFDLPSDYRKISQFRIISIHANYGLPAENSR